MNHGAAGGLVYFDVGIFQGETLVIEPIVFGPPVIDEPPPDDGR